MSVITHHHLSLPAMPEEVAAAFDAFPVPVRARLLQVRSLIFELAARTEEVGPLTETLKWGEPAYLTQASGSGSTIRLGWFKPSDRACALLFNCKTTLVETFRAQFPDDFEYEKNRAVILDTSAPLPAVQLSFCLTAALTYHTRLRRG